MDLKGVKTVWSLIPQRKNSKLLKERAKRTTDELRDFMAARESLLPVSCDNHSGGRNEDAASHASENSLDAPPPEVPLSGAFIRVRDEHLRAGGFCDDDEQQLEKEYFQTLQRIRAAKAEAAQPAAADAQPATRTKDTIQLKRDADGKLIIAPRSNTIETKAEPSEVPSAAASPATTPVPKLAASSLFATLDPYSQAAVNALQTRTPSNNNCKSVLAELISNECFS